MRIPSAIRRRTKGPKVPKGITVTYRRLLDNFISEYHSAILEILLEGWESNPIHFSGAVPRQDASGYVLQKLGSIRLRLEEKFNPGTQLSRDVKTVAARVNEKGAIEFRRLVGIVPRTLLDPDQTFLLDAFRDQNVNLIKSLQGNELDRITEILQEAERGGWRVEELRKEIVTEFGTTKAKADLLARDQVLKLNGQLNQTRQTNAGVTKYIWTTTGDNRVRGKPGGLWPNGMHYELDGTIQDWNNPPIISPDGRRGHPGDDYQCRCIAYPVIPELDE